MLPARLHSAAFLILALAGWGAGDAAAVEQTTREPIARLRGAFILNEDNSHFFSSRPPTDMNLAGLHALVDGYAGSKVTHLFFSPNAMRASFRSQSRDAIWDPVGNIEPDGRWPQNAKRLDAAGLDPYAIWIHRCREKGVSPWLSMRMNDVHSVDDPGSFMHSTFWRTHPELRRVPDGPATPWVNQALNYAHASVRAYQLAFVRELLERYDPDGLELDWMRFGHHLTPGREREEGPVLTDFVREVRILVGRHAARLGHPILLGVRVPSHPDAAAGLGMDAIAWARDGLIDLIVPGPFWSTSDFDIPVELWRERLGSQSAHVAVAPGLEYNARAWPSSKTVANDLASARGFAASAWHRGADSLYVFNWMDSETRPVGAEEYATFLRDGLGRLAVQSSSRRFPVTYRDTVPAGFPNGVMLPIEAPSGGSFRVYVGPRPVTGKTWAIAGLTDRPGVSTTRIEAKLNGWNLGTPQPLADLRGLGGVTRALRFPCPQEAVREGYNELSLRQTDSGAAQQIVWVELRVNEP